MRRHRKQFVRATATRKMLNGLADMKLCQPMVPRGILLDIQEYLLALGGRQMTSSNQRIIRITMSVSIRLPAFPWPPAWP